MVQSKINWPSGNYLDWNRTKIYSKIQFVGSTSSASNTKADALSTLTTIKTGIASKGFTGTGSTLGSAAHVAKVEDSTAFVTATANDCSMIFIDKCIELYPTKCKLQESGAINAIASLGAATIALAVLF